MSEYSGTFARNVYKQTAVSHLIKIQQDADLVENLTKNLEPAKEFKTAEYAMLLYGAALSHPGNKVVDEFIRASLSDLLYNNRKKLKVVLKPYVEDYKAKNPGASYDETYLYPLTNAVEAGDVQVMEALLFTLDDTSTYKPFTNAFKQYDEYTLLFELKRLYPNGF